jgi:hypothetical protein
MYRARLLSDKTIDVQMDRQVDLAQARLSLARIS